MSARTGLVCLVAILAGAGQAHAQGFIVPYVGYDFAGNSSCGSTVNCEGKHFSYGAAFGTLGGSTGFETDFAYAKNFFGSVPGVDNSVFSWMNNFLIGGGGGRVQPYGLVGFGIIKSHANVDPAVALIQPSYSANSLSWDVGVGVHGYFTKSIGIRVDVRRFQTFEDLPLIGSTGGEKLDYWRGSLGLVLRF